MLSLALSKWILVVHPWPDSMEFRGIGRGSSDSRMIVLSGLTITILLGQFSCQSAPIFMTDRFKLDVNLPLAERIRSHETNTESSIKKIPWVF